MINNRKSGDEGEKEIIKLINCPNCGKKLMLLPSGYPLYDVQCTGCNLSRINGWKYALENCEIKPGIINPEQDYKGRN